MMPLRWLLLSRFFGGLGYQVFVLSGLYQIYQHTQSATMAGLMGLVLFLPVAVLNLFLGDWADRLRFKARAYCGLQFGVLILSTSFFSQQVLSSNVLLLGAMLAYSFLRAARTPLQYILMTTASALGESPMAKGRLAQLSTLSWQLPLIVGPFLFSFLQSLSQTQVSIDSSQILSTNTVTFIFFLGAAVCSAPSLSSTAEGRDTEPALVSASSTPISDPTSNYDLMPISWTELFRQNSTWIRASLIDLAVMGTLAFVSLMPFLLSNIHQDPAKLGYLRSAISVGAFACVWIFEVPLFRKHRKVLFSAALVVASAAVLLLPSAGSLFGLIGLAFVFGFCDGFSILYRDFLLFSLPKQILGKASAVSQILNSASEDLGEFRAGALGGMLGTGPAIVCSAVFAGALSVAYCFLRKENRPSSPAILAVAKIKRA